MKSTKKLVTLLSLLLMVIIAVPTLALTAIYADDDEVEAASGTSIDLYLIGGQSNASGTSKIVDTNAAYALAPELKNGFSHVLYAGKPLRTSSFDITWEPTKLGMGQNTDYLGPEAGMAVALSKYYNAETGKIAGILKYAHGGSKLSGNDTTNTSANWVSPSYAEANGWDYGTAPTGLHYAEFVKVFKEKVTALVDMGYTDINIKGMYWMQGEGDRGDNDPTNESRYYAIALKYLISDLRADLSDIMKEVYVTDDGGASDMPFYIGAISETFALSNSTTQALNQKFIEIQKSVAAEVANCYFIDNSQYKISEYDPETNSAIVLGSDTAHWNQSDILTIGQTVGFDMYNYGVIPDEYASTSTYPFVVFNEGTFVGAAKTWANANNLARVALDASNGSTISVFMRADVSSTTGISHNDTTGVSDRIAFMNGTVVIDLGGNTITNTKTLFEGGTKVYAGSFDTTYIVKNGTVLCGSGVIFATESRSNHNKKMDIVFDNVRFDTDPALIEANSRNKMFLSYSDSASYTGILDLSLTFNNCKMNLSGFSETCAYTVFSFPSTPDDVAVDITFNGGEILTDEGFDYVTLANIDANDTLVFDKNASGNYTTLTVPEDYTPPFISGVNNEGKTVVFCADNKAKSGYLTYSLRVERDTAYGEIPENYANFNTYPFAMFVDGQFKSVATNWTGALNNARAYLVSNPGDTVNVLMRINQNGTWNPVKLGHVMGTINIDLGGYSLTRTNWSLLEAATNDYTDSSSVIHTMDDTKSATAANIIVKNGTILANGSVVAYQVYNNYDKTINVTFDTVKFALAKTAVSQLSVSWAAQNSGTGIISSDINFKNCTFDFTDIVPESTLYLSDFARGASSHKINVTFDGGSIKGTVSNIKPYSISANDTVKFINSGNGYTKYLASAGTPVTGAMTTDKDTMYFAKDPMEAVSGYTVYKLGVQFSGYGTVPAEYYYDTSTYPFVAAKNGTFIGAGAWAKINNVARVVLDADNGATVNIIMRANATSNSIATEDRICFMNGTVTVDLGGKTLTSSNTVFEGGTKTYTGSFDTTYIVKNGTVLCGKGFIFATESRSNYDKKMDIVFDGVTFDADPALIAANSRNRMFLSYNDQAAYTGLLDLSLTFNNCVMDLRGLTIAYTVFNFPSTPDDVAVDITFNGGKILGDASFDGVKLATIDSNDTFKFGKYNNAYTTLTLPVGVNAPETVFNTVIGENVIFKKTSSTEAEVNYALKNNDFKIVTTFLNLTSDINIYFRTNIPAGYTDPYMQFVFNGNTYSTDEYIIDENGTYCFAFKNIAPQYMGVTVNATLYATYNGETVSYESNGFSILTYCKYLLDNHTDEKLLALVSDLLVYGAKAQVYADYDVDNLVTNGLTLDDASVFETLDQSANKLTLTGEASELADWKNVGLYLENDIALKLGFTAESTEGLTVEITVNGNTTVIDTSTLTLDDDGVYRIYFDGILAVSFDQPVTAVFKLNGEQIGQTITYSVNSYIYINQNSDDNALLELIEAIYNYGKSANTYFG